MILKIEKKVEKKLKIYIFFEFLWIFFEKHG